MYNIVKEWFLQNPQNNVQILDQYFMQYEIVKSNSWIFNLLNNLETNIKNEIIYKYFNNTIDVSKEIDIHDPITLYDIQQKEYQNCNQGVRVGEFLTDLKRCIAEIETMQNIFMIKVADPKYHCCKLVVEKTSTIQNKLKSINLGHIMDGKKKIIINGLSVYNCGSNANFIKNKQISFLSDKVGTFNFYKFFDINTIPVPSFNMETIKPFVNHVYTVICNSNADLYNYLMKWVATIFQFPCKRTCTALVITSPQGACKNTFTNQICKLLGFYAEDNTKSDAIFSEFNSVLFYKKLLVCNEDNKKMNFDLLKSLITEDTIQIKL